MEEEVSGWDGSRFKEAPLFRSKAISVRKKCERMVCHVHRVASNRCVNWSWSLKKMKRVKERKTVMMRKIYLPLPKNEKWRIGRHSAAARVDIC